ncbi:hypothetical protein HZC35_05145 [Candidatus Saganbacteria bacterium]|nr:hypothetical protein [Candidatus Saganbacteria bacterium]
MEIPKINYQPVRSPQGAIADPPQQEYTPPPVPQDVEDAELPENSSDGSYNYTDWVWYRLFLNSQFPPVRPQDTPPPQD